MSSLKINDCTEESDYFRSEECNFAFATNSRDFCAVTCWTCWNRDNASWKSFDSFCCSNFLIFPNSASELRLRGWTAGPRVSYVDSCRKSLVAFNIKSCVKCIKLFLWCEDLCTRKQFLSHFMRIFDGAKICNHPLDSRNIGWNWKDWVFDAFTNSDVLAILSCCNCIYANDQNTHPLTIPSRVSDSKAWILSKWMRWRCNLLHGNRELLLLERFVEWPCPFSKSPKDIFNQKVASDKTNVPWLANSIAWSSYLVSKSKSPKRLMHPPLPTPPSHQTARNLQ